MHAYCMVVLTFITAAKKHVYQLCFLPFIDSFCRDNTNVYIYTHTDIHQHVYIYKYKDIYLYIICVCVCSKICQVASYQRRLTATIPGQAGTGQAATGTLDGSHLFSRTVQLKQNIISLICDPEHNSTEK